MINRWCRTTHPKISRQHGKPAIQSFVSFCVEVVVEPFVPGSRTMRCTTSKGHHLAPDGRDQREMGHVSKRSSRRHVVIEDIEIEMRAFAGSRGLVRFFCTGKP